MARILRSIDIKAFPELVRVIDDALARGEPVVLRDGERDLVMVEPIVPDMVPGTEKHPRSPEALDAFLSSAGSWKGIVDADQLLSDIYEGRGRPMEPESE